MITRPLMCMLLLCSASFCACGDDPEQHKTSSPMSASNKGNPAQPDPSKPENMTMNPAMNTQDACMAAEDCAYWYCRCDDGGVVNGRFCAQGFCSGPGAICPDACMAFGGKTWTGFAGGGVKQEPPQKDPPTEKDMGTTPLPTGPQTCDTTFTGNTSSCDQCANASCCEPMQRCEDNLECLDYWDCHLRDRFSREECDEAYPSGSFDYEQLDTCLRDECASACL